MSYYYKPDRTICDYHGEIIEIAKDIERLRYDRYENIEDACSQMQTWASQIETLAEYARVCGQKMEDRLIEYKDAIESLGFKRIKP